jgi:natural product precursor
MKQLNQLQINPLRLMENEELLTLRGGYGSVYCGCRISGSTCATQFVETCDGQGYGSCQQFCAYYCPNYTEFICVG